jgi:soluble P-type ATPase
MIDIDIPGFGHLQLEHLVSDYNGTLALDGQLLPGVAEALTAIATQLRVHIVTADTFGVAAAQLQGLPVELSILPVEGQAEAKRDLVRQLGAERVVAIGNGRNDRKMLHSAALGIALVQQEGGALETLLQAKVVATSVLQALELLQQPRRLTATLRS